MLPPIFIQPTDTAVSCKVGDNLNFVIDDKNLAGTTVSTDNKDIVELTQAGEKDGATYTAGGKCLAAGTATITVTAPDNTKRDITKVDDLSGLKFRVGGGMVNEISKTLAMNVTLKPAPDSYELISGGVMDGTLFPAESTESFKIDKLIRYATTFPGGLYNTSFVFMMNPASPLKLSPK